MLPPRSALLAPVLAVLAAAAPVRADVPVVELVDVVHAVSAQYVVSAIERADAEGAPLLVIRIVTPGGYDTGAYGGQTWLFDGSAGAAFTRNTALPDVDIASVHLYPEAWGLTAGSGSAWITDHLRIAGNLQM